jgi:hypothetical protein
MGGRKAVEHVVPEADAHPDAVAAHQGGFTFAHAAPVELHVIVGSGEALPGREFS